MNASHGIGKSALGNAVALAALAMLACWLLRLQSTPWPTLTPSPAARLYAALALVAYLGSCGWIAWRSRARQVASSQIAAGPGWKVIYASQTGFALELAQRTAAALRDAGCEAHLLDIANLDAGSLAGARCLFVASTTGEGDPPDHALGFVRRAMAQAPDLRATRYAVLALGDREYAGFCAFGRQLDAWLRHRGAQPLFDLVEVDNADPAALRHWQHHVGVLAGRTDQPDWSAPHYQRWTLRERRLLNPGSTGGPAFHIALEAPAGVALDWQAGDIAEIGPRGDADAAQPLPHREYSIASTPADGRLELLVRLMRRPDGSPGIGSGWLCEYAPIDGGIDLRIRSNPNFHAPDHARPMILIGNGTGLAGLRAHLKQRIAAGAHRNWLLFGERSAAHDRFHGDELDAWLRDGKLAHLDLVHSRDGGAFRYVQDALRANAARLRAWLDDGAAIYVCGSLQGLAPGVHAVLVELLGEARVDALTEAGRYRRDVY